MKSNDITETAEMILRIADKLHREKNKSAFYGKQVDETDKTQPIKNYSEVVSSRIKKKNITPENIGEIILNQIPGISKITSSVILNHFGSFYNLLMELKKNKKCMDSLSYVTKTGSTRNISKTSIRNIIPVSYTHLTLPTTPYV